MAMMLHEADPNKYFIRTPGGVTVAAAARRNKRCVWHIRKWHQGVAGNRWVQVATVRPEIPEQEQRHLVMSLLSVIADDAAYRVCE